MRFRYEAQLPFRAGMSQGRSAAVSIMNRRIQAGEVGRMSRRNGLALENMDEVGAIRCGQAGNA